jgi:hypothetical protein
MENGREWKKAKKKSEETRERRDEFEEKLLEWEGKGDM